MAVGVFHTGARRHYFLRGVFFDLFHGESLHEFRGFFHADRDDLFVFHEFFALRSGHDAFLTFLKRGLPIAPEGFGEVPGHAFGERMKKKRPAAAGRKQKSGRTYRDDFSTV